MQSPRPHWLSRGSAFSGLSLLLLVAAVLASLVTPGCREQSSAPIDRNHAPETVLVGVPGDTSTAFYRVRLFWNGSDPDGEVVAYEWGVTDSLPGPDGVTYHRTEKTDSIFVFPVTEEQPVLGHRFYVRAIDNEGKVDPTPAWTFFTAKDICVPRVNIVRALAHLPGGRDTTITSTDARVPTDTIPSGSAIEFAWTGTDCDSMISLDGVVQPAGSIAGYYYHLSPLELGYIGGGTNSRSVSYDAARLHSNLYVFYVRAKDDAGLSGRDPAVRSFVWNMDPVTKFTTVDPGDTSRVVYIAHDQADLDRRDFGALSVVQPGDTLPLPDGQIFLGAKIRARDPDLPNTILRYQAKLMKDFPEFWQEVPADNFLDHSNIALGVGDFMVLARAMDGLNRWDGTPDTIRFSIDYPPRWLPEWPGDNGTITERPTEGGRYPANNQDTLTIRVGVFDPDFNPLVETGLQFKTVISLYPLPDSTTRSEVGYLDPVFFLPVANAPQGTFARTLTLKFRDPTARFIPGHYQVTIWVQEVLAGSSGNFGRGRERTISFDLY